MNDALLEGQESLPIRVHLVWSSQLGAREDHVASAAGLMSGARVRHYWDGQRASGRAFQEYFPGLESPAWDVWMLFAPGVTWEGERPPRPSWWEHQLGVLDATHGDLRLDAERFATRARDLADGKPVDGGEASPESSR